MKTQLLLAVLLLIISCKKRSLDNYYYPSKADVLGHFKNNQKLALSSFQNFEKLIDTLERINCLGNNAIFKLTHQHKEFNFIASTLFGNCSSAPHIKYYNLLSISKDSILKNKSKFPIDSLAVMLKRDLLNYGKDKNYSRSPKKLIVSITEKKYLKNVLLKVFTEFNQIQSETIDSLTLNIQFNRRFEILPPVPPPPLEIIE